MRKFVLELLLLIGATLAFFFGCAFLDSRDIFIILLGGLLFCTAFFLSWLCVIVKDS
jgi:hypothetical protein